MVRNSNLQSVAPQLAKCLLACTKRNTGIISHQEQRKRATKSLKISHSSRIVATRYRSARASYEWSNTMSRAQRSRENAIQECRGIEEAGASNRKKERRYASLFPFSYCFAWKGHSRFRRRRWGLSINRPSRTKSLNRPDFESSWDSIQPRLSSRWQLVALEFDRGRELPRGN